MIKNVASLEHRHQPKSKKANGKFRDINKRRIVVDVTKDLLGFSFKPFYHPYAEEIIETLNKVGLPGIFDLLTKTDNGTVFSQYIPNTDRKPDPLVQEPLPVENFTFDIKDPYATVNWFTFYHVIILLVETLMENNKNKEAIEWIEKCLYSPKKVGGGPEEFWKIPVFRQNQTASTTAFFNAIGKEDLQSIVGELNEDPFNPFLVAYHRPQEFMMYVVSLYVKAHIAVGDDNFRMIYNGGGMDYLNTALEYYKIAKLQLGKRPQSIPNFLKKKPETYQSLKDKGLNPAANSVVQYENMFPFCSDADIATGDISSGGILGGAYTFYFSIPPDKNVLELHDLVDDRLAKLRSCRDIDGVVRKIDLFGTRINPAKLLSALAKGLSLGDVLGGLFAPAPIYRFMFSLRKAMECCEKAKALGSSIAGAIEKRDSEKLAVIRSQNESTILSLQSSIKERQILDAKIQKQALLKTRENIQFRHDHYKELLGIGDPVVPAYTDMPTDLTIDSALPTDTIVSPMKEDVDVSLVDSDFTGVKLIPKENKEITATKDAADQRSSAGNMEQWAAIIRALPDVSLHTKPIGVGFTFGYGSANIAAIFSAIGRSHENKAAEHSHDSNMAAKFAGYIRREQDWTFQLNQASKEIVQIDKQLASADIKIQIAEEELKIHNQQIAHAKEVGDFMVNKDSNFVNYQFIIDKLKPIHKKLYDLAMYHARSAEQAFQFEHPEKVIDFVSYDYDNSIVGFSSSGDGLNLQLHEMEKVYLQNSARPNCVEKKISLNTLDPVAFLKLRKEGRAVFSIPEWLILVDNPSVYNAKWATIRFSLPLLAGPHVNLHVKIRMLKNMVRIKPTGVTDEKDFAIKDTGPDDRFVQVNSPFTEVTISSALNDNGLKLDMLGFAADTYQNQYLPFQNTGFVCDLEVNLRTHHENGNFFQLDWESLNDLIVTGDVSFKEDEGTYKAAACKYLNEKFKNVVNTPFCLMMDVKRDFSNEYYAFTSGTATEPSFTIKAEHFPYLAQSKKIKISGVVVLSTENLDDKNGVIGTTSFKLKEGEEIDGYTCFESSSISGPNFPIELRDAFNLKIPVTKENRDKTFVLLTYTIQNQ